MVRSVKLVPVRQRVTDESDTVRHRRRERGSETSAVRPNVADRREGRTEDAVGQEELSAINHRSRVVAGGAVRVGVASPLETLGSEGVGRERERTGSEGDGEHDRRSVDFLMLGHQLGEEDGVVRGERLRLLRLGLFTRRGVSTP